MPPQPTQNKKSFRKKAVSATDTAASVTASEEPGYPSSSGIASSRSQDEQKPRPVSTSNRKQRGATSSNRGGTTQPRQPPNGPPMSKFSHSPNSGIFPVDKQTLNSRHSRPRNKDGRSSVGARFVKQMQPGVNQEEIFMAMGYCEPYDCKTRRPKPAAQVYQNRTFMNSTLVSNNPARALTATSTGWNNANNNNYNRNAGSSQYPGGFGPPIPEDVLNDICFRFLINIPEEEKSNVIRICFQIELAHWFYIDFYCKSDSTTIAPKCTEIGLKDFIRQIFNHCDFLSEFSGQVDQVIEKWREYKSSVPTYGAILLDSSLNYVLLVQGYYARNSWGFPKGKVNESEEPTDCAAREVLEEVGFDISDKIRDNRLIQKFINETMTRLYIVTDVPTDYSFAPKTRNEIGKIQWFSVWDLPTDRNNPKACERIGLVPNNFYTVVPFVSDLQAYIVRQQNKRNKMKPKMGNPLRIGERSASAFDPVLPHQKLEFMPSVFTSLFPGISNADDRALRLLNHNNANPSCQTGSVPSLISNRILSPPSSGSTSAAFFKPLSTQLSTPPQQQQPITFTGHSFLQHLTSTAGAAGAVAATANANASASANANSASTSKLQDEHIRHANVVARPVPTVPKLAVPPLGRPVYEAAKRHRNERKSLSTSEVAKEEVVVSQQLPQQSQQQQPQQPQQQSQQISTAFNQPQQEDIVKKVEAPKETSTTTGNGSSSSNGNGNAAKRKAAPRRQRNRKSERETDSDENTTANTFSSAILMAGIQPVNHSAPINNPPSNSINSIKVSPTFNEPIIQLCDAWKSFKLDVSKLFATVA